MKPCSTLQKSQAGITQSSFCTCHQHYKTTIEAELDDIADVLKPLPAGDVRWGLELVVAHIGRVLGASLKAQPVPAHKYEKALKLLQGMHGLSSTAARSAILASLHGSGRRC